MVDVTDIGGIGKSRAESLADEGFESVADIAAAEPDELTAIGRLSDERAREMIVEARELFDSEEEEDDDDEIGDDEFDLTPAELKEELEKVDEAVDDVDSETDEEQLERIVEEDEEILDELDDDEETYEIVINFDTRLQYHTFHEAIMTYHQVVYTSNQPASTLMQHILDSFDGMDEMRLVLEETELNTLHTAIKQTRTTYQGDNMMEHMEAIRQIEEQIDEVRREHLF